MSENVYIIGAGIHPFGRTDGRSGREQVFGWLYLQRSHRKSPPSSAKRRRKKSRTLCRNPTSPP